MSVCYLFGGILVTLLAIFYGANGIFYLFKNICLFFKELFFFKYGEYVAIVCVWAILIVISGNVDNSIVDIAALVGIIFTPACVLDTKEERYDD